MAEDPTHCPNKTPNVTFGYDADGRRTAMHDGTGTSSYGYDSLGRLTQHVNGAGSKVSYGYDLKDQLTSLTYPAFLGGTATTVTRGYDDAGRLTSVSDWLHHTTQFGYDAAGNLTRQSYPNTVLAVSSYDTADRQMGITDTAGSATLLNLNYSRGGVDQLTAENATTYGYDTINRLTGANSSTAISYGYSPADDPYHGDPGGHHE